MDKIEIFQSLTDDGAGAVCINYFLAMDDAIKDQEEAEEEGWSFGEPIINTIETYKGSNIYNEALENESRKGN